LCFAGRQADLQAIYENLARTAIHTVKPANIATFLGRKLHGQYKGEMGNRFNIHIEGTRIKHTTGPVSIKLYDKFGLILRIETTVNDLTFFKHYRELEHRDGSRETKWASMQKTIYSLPALRELLEAANRRYLEFLSAIEDPRVGRNKLDKLSRPMEQEGRRYSGFNLFDPDDVPFAIRYHQTLRFYPDKETGYESYTGICLTRTTFPPLTSRRLIRCSQLQGYMESRLVTLNDLCSFNPHAVVEIEPFIDIIGLHFNNQREETSVIFTLELSPQSVR
jgi:hypothetical protein